MTRRRIWAAGLALAASLAHTVSVGAEGETHAGRVVNTDGAQLRLRAAPDPAGPFLKRLGPARRLTVLDAHRAAGPWLRVEHAGTAGYAAANYIALNDELTAPNAERRARRDGLVGS